MVLFSTVGPSQKGWAVFGLVVVASMCLKEVTSVPSPVPSQPEHGARCSSPGHRRAPTLLCQPSGLE